MVLYLCVLFCSIKGIAPKCCLSLPFLIPFPSLFHLWKAFHITNIVQFLFLSNSTCTIATVKVEYPFLTMGGCPLCRWTMLMFSKCTVPAPEKISGCSWNFPVFTHTAPLWGLQSAFLVDKQGIVYQYRGRGWLSESDTILATRFHAQLRLYSVQIISFLEFWAYFSVFSHGSTKLPSGWDAYRLMSWLQSARKSQHLFAKRRGYAACASHTVIPRIYPPYSSHESVFVTCS